MDEIYVLNCLCQDVILARALDGAVVANLNSIIHSNNAAVRFILCYHCNLCLIFFLKTDLASILQVVTLLRDNISFNKELFSRLNSPNTPIESKRTLVNICPLLIFFIYKPHVVLVVLSAIEL